MTTADDRDRQADGARPTLPAVVARMWGREPTVRRGPRPSLDLERITTAAVEIADADGLTAVSMSNVASQLGVATMSLYRYVGSKDELLTAMADAAAGEPPEIADRSRRKYLSAWTRANRDVFLARPWLLGIARNGPPQGPRALRWLDRLLAVFADTPLTEGEKIGIATALSGYAVSEASLTVALTSGDSPQAGPSSAQDYGDMLGRLIDAEHYPALAAAVRARAFAGGTGWIDDADFRFGLGLLLDGIDALIDRRTAEDRRN